jgi:hypothetical protein
MIYFNSQNWVSPTILALFDLMVLNGLLDVYSKCMTRLKHGQLTIAQLGTIKIRKEADSDGVQIWFDTEVIFTDCYGNQQTSIIAVENEDNVKNISRAKIIYLPWEPYDSVFLKALEPKEQELFKNESAPYS